MPVVHKSTIKAARQAEKRRERNRAVMSNVKGMIKKVGAGVTSNDPTTARASLREATAAISKAVTKGVLKRNTASRKISQLALKVNAVPGSKTESS